MSTTEPPPDSDIPRVLLFGHRGAGKSALIGALLQAGETQGETLRGEVVHSSVDLPRMRDAVYSGAPIEPSQRELVSYTIRLRPWRVATKPIGEPLTIILDDCDGKAAESLLEDPRPIATHQPDSPVARAVVGADALLLLVDAASTKEELTEAFAEFDTFLKVITRAKTESREVGGFPIFLVLTQCDRLARSGDTIHSWEAHVNERSETAWKAFEAFLKEAAPDDAQSPYLPFGSIDLSVMAVAVRRPPLTGLPTIHNQPYGVAELFRDCFAEANAHHKRVQASDTRLKWTVRFAITAVAVLFTSLAAISLFSPQSTAPALAEKVRDYEVHEPPAAIRLADGQLERNKRTLRSFTTDRDFPDLEPDLRVFVESRLKEIEDYEAYQAKLANATAPASARSVPELAKIRNSLLTDLALPPQYAWEETPAGELHNKWSADCTAIESAEKELVARYRAYDRDGTALMLARNFDSDWLTELAALVAKGSQPPFPLNEPIRGSPAINQPRGEVVLYSVPYEFDEVYSARRYWEQTRDRLLHLRDLCDALGLTTAPNRPQPVLVLPPPDGIDSATLAQTRLSALRRTYPQYSDDYAEWELSQFPDPARAELALRLKREFDTGVRHVHKLMKVQDTKESWKQLDATLSQPTFREWGRLLHLLARLQDPSAPNPVTELADFLSDLDTKAFELDLRGFELTIPLDLTVGLDRVDPIGPLTVTVSQRQEPRGTAKFTVGKGETRGKVTVYPLTLEGTGKLKYFAGDDFRAELPVKAGTQQLQLIWDRGDSNTFRFDRLSHVPRLVKANGSSDSAVGVRLIPSPGSSIPRFPALLPLPAK